jgi:hypothetical protein
VGIILVQVGHGAVFAAIDDDDRNLDGRAPVGKLADVDQTLHPLTTRGFDVSHPNWRPHLDLRAALVVLRR